MRVLVVGASGTVGQATVKAFTDQGDEVVAASRNSSPGIDITDVGSVKEFFNQAGSFDAIVATLGSAPFVHLKNANTEDFQAGLNNKLQGQINLVLHGLPHLADGGSFTLITGILTQHPVEKSVVASTVNGGLEAFTYAASTDLPRGIRINTVSPNAVEESLDTYGAFFPGSEPVSAQSVANAFVRSAHGVETSQIFKVW
ncbi:short chain dehydrogenase [Corynebacterium sp. J010B-136]|uniref:short chain dehydrogenase n=1 Tax=Corynebacterium sp. J010B-136 TaxID=2099401 RepID=UPI000CF94FAD|nr:short chain dehydrogenase [Corynebacterium sp. J010B-136]PQM73359.1 short chain dehydrogenase [Corynebacterium sp. J010B-136]